MSKGHITSTTNPFVKALVRLRTRPERDLTGRFIIEGHRELARGFAAGVTIESVVICPSLADGDRKHLADDIAASGAGIITLGEAAFRKIAYRSHPDGILGVGSSWDPDLTVLESGAQALVLIVTGVEKPGNLGAMLRTADAVGVDAVIVVDAATDLTNPGVIRSSQGAVFAVPVATASVAEAMSWCTSREIELIAGVDDAAEAYWDIAFPERCAVIVGAEATGLDPAWRETTHPVRIPMAGISDSLNVAAAAAVLLYEAVRQRTIR